LVERDKKKTPALQKNLSFVNEETRLLIMPAERFLKFYREQFDIIFLDPPFAYRYKAQLLRTVAERRRLKQGGKLCMHLPKQEPATDRIGGLVCERRNYYGGSALLFYRSE
jgi:16S rRNA G966 N2-methylase RsmD